MISTEVFTFVLFVPALAGILISLIPSKIGCILSRALCCVSCFIGIFTFFVTTNSVDNSVTFQLSSLLGDYKLLFDDLSALMISLSSVVFLLVTLHSIKNSEVRGNHHSTLLSILFISCILAMCADSVILLLISWEMISLTTFLMSYGADDKSRWNYFIITHLGGLMIMCVFAGLYVINGTGILSEMSQIDDVFISSLMILMLFLGFGTKLGCIPFHTWMPNLYKTSSIHSTALLSTVCSNVAILLLIKSSFHWIGVPETPVVPLIIILLASLSAIWGAMESLIQMNPRRILAYSSMENMAMVAICLGLGMLFSIMDLDTGYVLMIVVAGILHAINHSFFKSLMLLNVGTIEKSTGTGSIEKMGGLAKILPVLSIFALIGVLSMAAVPPLNGFISEWLMIKTVISAGVGDSIINIVLPLIITVLGICGTMAAVSYARLYGFTFLGRPKSPEAANAKKVDNLSMVPLGVLSVSCVVLGVFSMPLIRSIIESLCNTLELSYVIRDIIPNSLNPIFLTIMIVSSAVVIFVFFKLFRKDRKESQTWACGTDLDSTMQYSSVGFSQPLVHVFHPVYGDRIEVTDDKAGDVESYKVVFSEPFDDYVLKPLGKVILKASKFISKMQNGNIQTYLAYLLITLIVVLLGVRFL